ncbi:hypothetical protein EVAR_6433_1 [Eumeta japonica]|uniref:Uncharacterized protein n=1 Tax=Eumeta variegata TaxID=151549 RepID=A0A4C1TDH6_EUMVA|nr:hypothetical protein EVAR_6433_1 [Eumeta japonica]
MSGSDREKSPVRFFAGYAIPAADMRHARPACSYYANVTQRSGKVPLLVSLQLKKPLKKTPSRITNARWCYRLVMNGEFLSKFPPGFFSTPGRRLEPANRPYGLRRGGHGDGLARRPTDEEGFDRTCVSNFIPHH